MIATAQACAGKDGAETPEKTAPREWAAELHEIEARLDSALEAEDYPAAERLALEAIALIPESDEVARREMLPHLIEPLAFSLVRQKKFDKAEARYRRLLELWDAGPDPEVAQFQRLPALFEFAQLLERRAKYSEQEKVLKRATRLAQNLVRRVSGYYFNQPVQHAGGQRVVGFLSSGLLELVQLYLKLERFEEAQQAYARAVWVVERVFGMNPGAVAEVRNYYSEFEHLLPDSVERISFTPGKPTFQEMPPIAWLDEPPELAETDLLLWDKLWYEGQQAEGKGDLETALDRYLEGLDVVRANQDVTGEKNDAVLYSLSAVGRVLHKLGRDEEAADIYADSIEVRRAWDDSQLIAGLIEAGAFYVAVGMTQEAAAVLEEALPLVQKSFGNTHTNYALVRSLLARAAQQRGNAKAAVEDWDRYLLGLEVVLGYPNEWLVDLFEGYETALEELGRGEQLSQLRAYRRALEKIPSFEPARRALIACRTKLQSDRDVDKGVECFDGALSAFPLFPSGYRFAGSSLLWFADANSEAIGYFEKALNQFAVYPVVYNEMAYAYLGLDQLDAALGAAQFQIKLAPGDPNAYDTLGDVHKTRGDLEKAIQAYRTACALGMQASCERRELRQ